MVGNLVIGEGKAPDLMAVASYFFRFSRETERVLAQEVMSYTDMNESESVPVIVCGHMDGVSKQNGVLELKVGGCSVKILAASRRCSGVARITASSGVVYEDPQLVEEWDSLFVHFDQRLKEIPADQMASACGIPHNPSPVVQFKQLCADREGYFRMYGFRKNETGVYVRD